jgi:hypothetical protein
MANNSSPKPTEAAVKQTAKSVEQQTRKVAETARELKHSSSRIEDSADRTRALVDAALRLRLANTRYNHILGRELHLVLLVRSMICYYANMRNVGPQQLREQHEPGRS